MAHVAAAQTGVLNPCFVVQAEVKNFGFAEGQTVYNLKQIDPLYSPLPPTAGAGVELRKDITFGYGPLALIGYIDTSTLEVGIQLTILGIKLAELYGNLKDGIVANIDLVAVKGHVGFSLQNGNEMWIDLDLKVVFDGHYTKKVKIFSW